MRKMDQRKCVVCGKPTKKRVHFEPAGVDVGEFVCDADEFSYHSCNEIRLAPKHGVIQEEKLLKEE